MAPSSGRHDADDSATDRARIDYLAGEPSAPLDPADQAEMEDLRALLADPALWSEPPPELEDSVVAMIVTESGGAIPNGSAPADGVTPTGAVTPDGPVTPDGTVDLAAARQRKDRRTGSRRFTRPVFLLAAAAIVVAVSLSAVLLLRDSGTRHFDVALAPTDLVPAASGEATMTQRQSGWEIHLDATGLPRLDNGQFYQAWLRNPDGVLVPIGTFNEGADVTLWAGVSPANFPTMTITEESADGKQESSGQRVLVGTAVEQ